MIIYIYFGSCLEYINNFVPVYKYNKLQLYKEVFLHILCRLLVRCSYLDGVALSWIIYYLLYRAGISFLPKETHDTALPLFFGHFLSLRA